MSLETLNHLLFIAIIFVVVGVLLEGAEHVEEYKKSGWKPIVPKLGFVLLVIGLAGELALHPLMEQADTQIRVESDQKIAALNQQTEELKAENLKLTLNVENARAAQQKVETELARQQERAANAERALLELQERQRPRVLTAQQRSNFATALQGSQPAEKIQLGCAVGIEEACDFAHQFLTLFREAPWPIEYDRVDRMTTGRPTTGIALFKRGEPVQNSPLWSTEITPTLDILKRAFAAIGMNAEIIAHPTLENDRIQIYVGGKP